MHDHKPETEEPLYRQCRRCGRPCAGRSDRKFCSDGCRNQYHNEKAAQTNNCIRRITNILKRNRLILETFADEGDRHITVDRDTLHDSGFKFHYFTHMQVVEGVTIRGCYDLCYYNVAEDTIAIARTGI